MLFKVIDENILVTLVIKIDQTCVHLVHIGSERTWEMKRKNKLMSWGFKTKNKL